MKTRSGLSLFFALTVAALAGLSCSDRSPVSPGSNGLLTLDLRLSKVSEQAIDRVLVEAKNPPMEPVRGKLTVTGKTATGSLEVFPGKWLVVVEAFSGNTLCYRGQVGPVDVVAGKSTTTQLITLQATRDLVTEEVFIRWSETKGRVDPKDLVVGSEVDLVLRCRNEGSTDATGWRFEAYLDEVLLCSLNDVEILAGKEWLLWCSNWTATEGTHTVEFRLDTENIIGENDETNNNTSLTFTIQPPVDLVAEEVFITRAGGDVPIDPNSLMEGDEVDLNVRVRNTSSSDIAGWKAQSYINGEAYRHGDFSVGAHSATRIFATWTAVAGTHTVTWTVDSENVIKESDETNNTARLSFTVQPSISDRADLVAEEVFITWAGEYEPIDPNSLTEGDEVDLNLTYSNVGTMDATGWHIEVYVDGIPAGSVDRSIEANSTDDVWLTWTATEGTHTVAFRLDTEDIINEKDESNNTAELSFTVRPDEAERKLIAGRSVDGVDIGFTKRQVIEKFGEPSSVDSDGNFVYEESLVQFDENDRAWFIMVFPPYPGTTELGIGLGAIDSEVEGVYGTDYEYLEDDSGNYFYGYESLGIIFGFDSNDICIAIAVFRPAAAKIGPGGETSEAQKSMRALWSTSLN